MGRTTRQKRTSRPSGDGGESGEGADGDEDSGEGSHHLRMIRGENLEGLAGVNEPEGSVSYHCHGYSIHGGIIRYLSLKTA